MLEVPKVDVVFGPLPPDGANYVTISVSDLEYSSGHGGYLELSGKISADDYATNVQYLKSWLPVKVVIAEGIDIGDVIWDGLLFDPAPTETGEFEIKAQGGKAFLEDGRMSLCYMMITSPGDWGGRDGDPYNFDANDPQYEVTTDTAIRFRREGGGAAYSTNTNSGVCFWMPGFTFNRIKFHVHKTWTTPNTVLKVFNFKGPTGARTLIKQISLNGAADDFDQNIIFATPKDGIEIMMDCLKTVTANGRSEKCVVSNIRLYDIASTDDWVSGGSVKGVVADFVTRMGVYTTDDTINPSTVGSVLPAFWDRADSLDGFMDGLSNWEAPHWWGVFERDVVGKYRVAFSPWGSGAGRAWTIDMSEVNDRPAAEDDVYNRARIFYTSVHGKKKSITIDANPDPLAGTSRSIAFGKPREFPYEIDEELKQMDTVFATKIGNAALVDHAESKWSGQINVNSLWLDGVEHTSLLARHGDTLTITNWPTGGSKTFYINETTHHQAEDSGISVGAKAQMWESFFRKHPGGD